MTNYLRSNYRLVGRKIDSNAIAMGSSNTSAAATAIGAVSVAHGMGTTPTVAFATPVVADMLSSFNKAALKGLDETYASFITVSAPPKASSAATLVMCAMSSGVIMEFVWVAIK